MLLITETLSVFSFVYSFGIYIAPLQGVYSELLLTSAPPKGMVLSNYRTCQKAGLAPEETSVQNSAQKTRRVICINQDPCTLVQSNQQIYI